MTPLFKPTIVKYEGLYADDGLVEVNQLAQSLHGLSKISNSLVHFYLHEELQFDHRLYRVKYYARSPENGCLSLEMSALLTSSQLPLYGPLLLKAAEQILPVLWKVVLDTILGRNEEANAGVDALSQQAERYHQLASEMHRGHMADKKWLQDQISVLSDHLRQPFQQAAAPIGRSCRTETVWSNTPNAIEIDEPDAAVLRATSHDLTIGDAMLNVPVRIRALNLDTGAGRAEMVDEDGLPQVALKITDPVLLEPSNIYSRALDSQAVIAVTAKPTLKSGALHKLFVSDANPPAA